MRPLQIQVPCAAADRVLSLAAEHGARSPFIVQGERPGKDGEREACCMIIANLANDSVGRFVEAVAQQIDGANFIMLPVGALPLHDPLEGVDPAVRDVSRLSTLELLVASLQSIGAWRGLLILSPLAGVIAAYGLIFDVGYVLVAAMLINPMGAPALVSVIGIGIGDAHMFGRGAIRFVASLVLQSLAALALGFAYGLSISTPMMEMVTSLSAWGVVLALAAGAAGAQTQTQSSRDSLVSGTAAGFMVAAALAPPAAVLGLAVPLGRWDYFGLMAFLLALQYVAIAAGGWLLLHMIGVGPARDGIARGTARMRAILAAAVVLATVALVVLQYALEPRFLKADLSRTALEIARDAVSGTPGAAFIDSNAHFTRPTLERHDAETLLLEITVERRPTATAADAELERDIREHVQRLVRERMRNVLPFVQVTVLPGPSE